MPSETSSLYHFKALSMTQSWFARCVFWLLEHEATEIVTWSTSNRLRNANDQTEANVADSCIPSPASTLEETLYYMGMWQNFASTFIPRIRTAVAWQTRQYRIDSGCTALIARESRPEITVPVPRICQDQSELSKAINELGWRLDEYVFPFMPSFDV